MQRARFLYDGDVDRLKPVLQQQGEGHFDPVGSTG